LTWTPPVEGTYEIIATFKGSEAYYASYATTHLGVEVSSTLASSMEPETTELTLTEPTETAAFIATELAIIAAVAIAVVIGAVSFYILRKGK
jgi:hypothetical protein